MAGHTISADLTWAGDLKFTTTVGETTVTLDGDGQAGLSPLSAVVAGLAGCMAIDVALILQRGRHPLTSLSSRIVAHRTEHAPRRIERIELSFEIGGAVPRDAIERALALSREKYCSVWHSLRQDIELQVTFAVPA